MDHLKKLFSTNSLRKDYILTILYCHLGPYPPIKLLICDESSLMTSLTNSLKNLPKSLSQAFSETWITNRIFFQWQYLRYKCSNVGFILDYFINVPRSRNYDISHRFTSTHFSRAFFLGTFNFSLLFLRFTYSL